MQRETVLPKQVSKLLQKESEHVEQPVEDKQQLRSTDKGERQGKNEVYTHTHTQTCSRATKTPEKV